MAFSVQMPALGESVTEGTVTRWLKQEGDHVDVDEPLLEVSTDKVDTEIPSPAAGTLERIVVAEDETVEVGAELALIGDGDGGSGGGSKAAAPSSAPLAEEEPPSTEQPASAEQPAAEERPAEEPAPRGSGGSGTPVTMPALGESVTEGTVTRWLKQVGDHVDVDEPLLEVSTDKVDTEIPSPVAGTVLEITAAEDETVEVGAQLALVGDGSPASGSDSSEPTSPEPAAPASSPEPAAPEQASAAPKAESPWREPERPVSSTDAPQPTAASPAEPAEGAPTPSADTNGSTPDRDADGSPYVTPLVRKLAVEHGVDLTTVAGTGVGGRIRKQDVLAAAEKPAAPEAPRPPHPHRPPGRARHPRPVSPPPPTRPSCVAPRRSCPGCAASSRSGWWSRSRSPPS